MKEIIDCGCPEMLLINWGSEQFCFLFDRTQVLIHSVGPQHVGSVRYTY